MIRFKNTPFTWKDPDEEARLQEEERLIMEEMKLKEEYHIPTNN